MQKRTDNRLFHFWGNGEPEDHQFYVFESIAHNGLLLTIPTETQRDLYWYFSPDEDGWRLEYEQLPRVCFTSEADKEVQNRFGKFGIVIEIDMALRWGMAPVWYLPNYPVQGTQYGKFGEFVSRIVELTEDLKAKGEEAGIQDLTRKLAALNFAISHFKGMSGPEQDDRAYLIEKEWRLVAGFSYGNPNIELFQPLTKEQQRELPTTGRCCFNGLGGPDNTVARNIVEVRVPTRKLEERVKGFIRNNLNLFGREVPVVLPNDDKS